MSNLIIINNSFSQILLICSNKCFLNLKIKLLSKFICDIDGFSKNFFSSSILGRLKFSRLLYRCGLYILNEI